jgi:hypothetical protein
MIFIAVASAMVGAGLHEIDPLSIGQLAQLDLIYIPIGSHR